MITPMVERRSYEDPVYSMGSPAGEPLLHDSPTYARTALQLTLRLFKTSWHRAEKPSPMNTKPVS
jgi:hypothetical protein